MKRLFVLLLAVAALCAVSSSTASAQTWFGGVGGHQCEVDAYRPAIIDWGGTLRTTVHVWCGSSSTVRLYNCIQVDTGPQACTYVDVRVNYSDYSYSHDWTGGVRGHYYRTIAQGWVNGVAGTDWSGWTLE